MLISYKQNTHQPQLRSRAGQPAPSSRANKASSQRCTKQTALMRRLICASEAEIPAKNSCFFRYQRHDTKNNNIKFQKN